MSTQKLKSNPVLIQILSEIVTEEYDSYSEDVEFSEAFQKKMEKLIRAQKKPYWKYVNTVGKRVAMVIIAILLFFSATMSVSAIQKPVIEFIKNIYEKYTTFFPISSDPEGFIPDTIKTAYTLYEVPDGFRTVYSSIQEDSIIQIWDYKDNHSLSLTQYTKNSVLTLNTENAEEESVTFGQYKGILYKQDDLYVLFWTSDQYIFVLSYSSDDPSTIDLVELASNLVVMEPPETKRAISGR